MVGGPRGETKVRVLVGNRSVWYTVVGVGLVGDCRKCTLVGVSFGLWYQKVRGVHVVQILCILGVLFCTSSQP